MKVYDCFLFHDEAMLLEIRFNILHKYVDKFIITEANYLHNGNQKKLNFNINNYKEFKNQIEYIVVKDRPEDELKINDNDDKLIIDQKKLINGQKRETFQREKLADGLLSLNNDDLIIISDSDEIPNLKNIDSANIENEILFFKQKMFYYKLNLYYENFDWYGSKATKKKNFISPQWIRSIKNKNYPFWRLDTYFSKKKYNNIKFIEDGGWHFTCIKTPAGIHEKLLSFSHHHDYETSNTTFNDLEKIVEQKRPLYDHKQDKQNQNKWQSNEKLKKIDQVFLPKYIVNNKDKYKNWFDD